MEGGEVEPTWEDQLTDLFAVLAQSDGQPDPDTVRRLWGFLLSASGLALPSSDADDAAGTVLVALLSRLQVNATPIKYPVAYLSSAVRNAVAASADRRQRTPPVDPNEMPEPVPSDDDETSRRSEARDILRRAFDKAANVGDRQAVQVAITWLDLDDGLQRAPSTRDIASELGISHTTVERVLRRLRGYANGTTDE